MFDLREESVQGKASAQRCCWVLPKTVVGLHFYRYLQHSYISHHGFPKKHELCVENIILVSVSMTVPPMKTHIFQDK